MHIGIPLIGGEHDISNKLACEMPKYFGMTDKM